eukprot:TRINITY_DN3044_c0_g1_i3.p1 TRINITY_DN3044_c0_g1~~TRINITY_DN3044_c0_g1_i3.p1  ORF type:complete len:413 (+),score=55.12 TRINITY_DN3044_c0_g1_i3:1397-2635(+)
MELNQKIKNPITNNDVSLRKGYSGHLLSLATKLQKLCTNGNIYIKTLVEIKEDWKAYETNVLSPDQVIANQGLCGIDVELLKQQRYNQTTQQSTDNLKDSQTLTTLSQQNDESTTPKQKNPILTAKLADEAPGFSNPLYSQQIETEQIEMKESFTLKSDMSLGPERNSVALNKPKILKKSMVSSQMMEDSPNRARFQLSEPTDPLRTSGTNNMTISQAQLAKSSVSQPKLLKKSRYMQSHDSFGARDLQAITNENIYNQAKLAKELGDQRSTQDRFHDWNHQPEGPFFDDSRQAKPLLNQREAINIAGSSNYNQLNLQRDPYLHYSVPTKLHSANTKPFIDEGDFAPRIDQVQQSNSREPIGKMAPPHILPPKLIRLQKSQSDRNFAYPSDFKMSGVYYKSLHDSPIRNNYS